MGGEPWHSQGTHGNGHLSPYSFNICIGLLWFNLNIFMETACVGVMKVLQWY